MLAGRRLHLAVGLPLVELGGVLLHVVAAVGVGGDRLEQQEPRAHRAVRVLEAHGDEAHLLAGHLGAAVDREEGAGARVEGRIPGAPEALTGRARLEHVHRAAHGDERGLGLEDVELVLADAEADRTYALVVLDDGVRDEDALVVLAARLLQRVLRGLGHDDLVRLAVDHELPTALVDVVALLVLPDGQTPFLEEVHRGVHVAGDARHQVLAGDAHQVVADVVDVVLQRVVAAVQVHVLVDCGQAHGHRTRAVHGCLVDERDLQPVLLGPVGRLHRRAAGGHSATADQQVGFDRHSLELRHCRASPRKSPLPNSRNRQGRVRSG